MSAARHRPLRWLPLALLLALGVATGAPASAAASCPTHDCCAHGAMPDCGHAPGSALSPAACACAPALAPGVANLPSPPPAASALAPGLAPVAPAPSARSAAPTGLASRRPPSPHLAMVLRL